MHASSVWLPARILSLSRRFTVVLMAVAALGATGAVAALPTGANASTPQAISGLGSTQVNEILSGVPLSELPTSKVAEVLAKLPGFSTLPTGHLQEALTSALESLAGKGVTLGQLPNSSELVSKVKSALEGLIPLNQLLSDLPLGTTLQELLGGSLGTTNISQLVDSLLGSSAHPEELAKQILGSSPELNKVLGGTLTGQSFVPGTVQSLATGLGTTVEGVANDLGTTVEKLPGSLVSLTSALTNGKGLSIILGKEGLDIVTTPGEGSNGGAGGNSGNGGNGGSGSAGGAGGSGSGSGTTVEVTLPSAAATATATKAAAAKLAKVKIVGLKVKGGVATLTVQVPSAGTLSVSGKNVRAARVQSSRTERISVRVPLSKAGTASLRKGSHRLSVKLTASFAPVSGATSKATAIAAFH
jgi:hypothetical protein